MKTYIETYLKAFGLDPGDFIACEICEASAVDIHHIDARGMGGDPLKKKDVIGNLMALCRKCHEDFGDITDFKPKLREIHRLQLENKGLSSLKKILDDHEENKK